MARSARIGRILILGGTAGARELAGALAKREDLAVTLSLAGRTAEPLEQPVPVRRGGFGGAEGLASYLRAEQIDVLIDATHPYAAAISANAAEAARAASVPLLALRRPPWTEAPGDIWTEVDTMEDAAEALGKAPRRVFLALGRKELRPFEAAPQHVYLVRSVDPVDPPLAVPHAIYVTARGPFSEEEDRALLERHRIDAHRRQEQRRRRDLRQDRRGARPPPSGDHAEAPRVAGSRERRDRSRMRLPGSIMR